MIPDNWKLKRHRRLATKNQRPSINPDKPPDLSRLPEGMTKMYDENGDLWVGLQKREIPS